MHSLIKKIIDSNQFKYTCNDSANWKRLSELAYQFRTNETSLEFSNVLDELNQLLKEDFFYNQWKETTK